MNREDIIRMAREADIEWDLIDEDEGQIWYITKGGLERFAALVAAAEREACARVCESMRPSEREFDQRFYTACTLNANAIRARGQT